MKASQIFGIIFAIALIAFAIIFPTPEKYLRVSSYSYSYDNTWTDKSGTEYVGGDAYNYQMEASLKAGYMSGVLAMKSIAFVGGLLLFFLSLYSRVKCAAIEEQTRTLVSLLVGYNGNANGNFSSEDGKSEKSVIKEETFAPVQVTEDRFGKIVCPICGVKQTLGNRTGCRNCGQPFIIKQVDKNENTEKEEFIYCRKCGAKLSEHYVSCPHCGTDVIITDDVDNDIGE